MTTNTIRASVNESNFIQNMRLLFARSTSFISEALQNAYRAKATAIHIQISGNDLIISDNGKGIADFDKLFTFSESGWDEVTKQTHKPYGMGVASYFFACETLSFKSLGQQVTVCCADLLNGKTFDVTPSPVLESTVVHFQNLLDVGVGDLHQIIERLVLGFPIPVFVNGIELERPHRVTNDSVDFAAGKLAFIGDNWSLARVRFYLQGLPIGHVPAFPSAMSCAAVHLDSQRFEAVMPDRVALYNHDEQFSVIKKALRAFEVQHIKEQKKLYNVQEFESAKCFFQRFVTRLKDLNELRLLNDVNYLNCDFLHLTSCSLGETIDLHLDEYSREKLVSSGKVVVSNTPSIDEDLISPTLVPVMEQEGWLTLAGALDDEHWIFDYAVDAADLNVEIITKGNVKTDSYDCIPAELYDEVAVRVWNESGFDKHIVIENFVLRADDDRQEYDALNDSTTVVFSASCSVTPHACFSDFLTEGGNYMSDWEQEAADGWYATLERLKGHCDFAANICKSLYNRPALAQVDGLMAICISSDNAYRHTVMNLDADLFAKIAGRIGCDPALLAQSFRELISTP